MSKNERIKARERLSDSVDLLLDKTNIYVHQQAAPVQIIGAAVAAGLVLGAILGFRIKRVQKIYIERPVKTAGVKSTSEVSAAATPHTVAATPNSAAATVKGAGGLLWGLVAPTLIRVLQEQLISPLIEDYGSQLLGRAREAVQQNRTTPKQTVVPPQQASS